MINTAACFTAHRHLGNYTFKSPEAHLLRDKLIEPLGILIENEGVDTFISGGAIGGDQIAFFTVQLLKKKYPHIKNIVAIPFEKQYMNWKNEEILHWYNKMIQIADEVVYVDTLEGYRDKRTKIGEYSAAKLHIRNHYMVDSSKYLVAIYDMSGSGGTANCYNYAVKKNRIIYHVDPKNNFDWRVL